MKKRREKISWFVDAMMRENIFVTMKDTSEVFYYNYVDGGDCVMRQKLEMLYPLISRNTGNNHSCQKKKTCGPLGV